MNKLLKVIMFAVVTGIMLINTEAIADNKSINIDDLALTMRVTTNYLEFKKHSGRSNLSFEEYINGAMDTCRNIYFTAVLKNQNCDDLRKNDETKNGIINFCKNGSSVGINEYVTNLLKNGYFDQQTAFDINLYQNQFKSCDF